MERRPAVLEFEAVGKCYAADPDDERSPWAVRAVDLRLGPGEVLGLLGPNRAGKTTLAKLALTLCRATEGRVVRFDRPADDRRTLARVGAVGETPAFPPDMTADGLLHYLGALALVPRSALRRRIPAVLERVGLDDRAREPLGQFSKGMTRRLSIAQALLNEPDLIVLDEPTEGLDLDGRRLLREVVEDQSNRGCAILLITHEPREVERLCHRAVVLVNGLKTFDGPLVALTNRPEAGRPLELEPCLSALYGESVS